MQATAKNGLTFSGTASAISVSGGNHSHGGNTGDAGKHSHDCSVTYTNLCSGAFYGGSGAIYISGGVQQTVTASGGTDEKPDHSHSIPSSGDLSMSGSFTPSGSISGDTETRPINYTIRVWKRIA